MTVEIHDAAGMAGGYLYQCQGDSCPDDYVPFCESIDKPFKLEAYTDFVGVMLFSGPCPGGSASLVTAGTVEFTFYRTR